MEEVYGHVLNANLFFGGVWVPIVLLGFLALVAGQFHYEEAFRRLVRDSRIGRELELAFAAYGLPLLIVLMEMQRRRGGGLGGGLFRLLGIFLVVIIVIIAGILALIAFLIYRFIRRR